MPNVPLARELETLAPQFQLALANAPSAITGPKLVPSDPPAAMYAAVDTRIFVRARPVLAHESDRHTTVRSVPGMRNCVFMSPEVTLAGKTSVVPTSIPVDSTFTNLDSNEMVYGTTCRGLLDVAMEGGSAAILCYGQTGSGKTYTTTGLLRCIARDMEGQLRANTRVTVSFMEVHADGCRDLISGRDDVQILEDKHGAVQVLNATGTAVQSAADVARLTDAAIAARSTKVTGRNLSGSSRSHMAARFVVSRLDTPWVAPGILNVVDLAGSESAADAVGHDKERISETKFINSSLMTLKECIRARGQAAVTMKHVHIPFRQSKLTLLLRDSFELVVQRATKTAVIACVSPLLLDTRHTYNTLRYAALLYVSPKAGVVVQADARDPNSWSREEALAFIVQCSNGRVREPERVLPAGDGRALAQLPEEDFVARLGESCGIPPKAAKDIYTRVWKAVIDAKKLQRRNIQQAKVSAAAKRGEAAAIEKLAGGSNVSSSAGACPPARRRRDSNDSTEIVGVEELGPSPATRTSERAQPPRQHRAVPANLVFDEKENGDLLAELNSRMTNGYAPAARNAHRRSL